SSVFICGWNLILSRLPYGRSADWNMTSDVGSGAQRAAGNLAAHGVMRFRRRESGFTESLPDGAVGVEVDLPIIVVVAEGTHGQHRAGHLQIENLDHRSRVFHHVGYNGQAFPQHGD